MATEASVMVSALFRPDELALLEAAAAHEERSRSDVIRRAVRAYAKQLGVKIPKPRPKK